MILILVLALLASCAPYALRVFLRGRRNQLLARQLRQALQGMVHSLQVGTSFMQALERVSEEGENPLAQEFRTVVQSVSMGASVRQALGDLGTRIPLKEMIWFITAAQITQETGGSLAGVLGTLAATLQERETLREKVGALTAQGRASGVLLGALPFLLMAALYCIAPEMVTPLFTTAMGQTMLSGVILSVGVGGVVIFKIVSIKAD
jgi:tight adherence protein B